MATAIIAIIAPFPPETTIWDIINTLHPDDHTSLPLHLLYKIHQLQFIVSDSLIKSPLNLLNGDTSLYSPDETWKAGFYKNIASFLVQKGLPCSLTSGYYGWVDYDFLSDKNHGKPVALFDIKEDEWVEFAGTLATSDNQYTGFTAKTVYEDGSSRELRYHGNLHEIIKGF